MTEECFPGNLRDKQDAHGQSRELLQAQEPGQQIGVHVAQSLRVLERDDDSTVIAAIAESLFKELDQIREVGHTGGDFGGVVRSEAPNENHHVIECHGFK